MTVTVRPFRRRETEWEVDIRVHLPNHGELRQRRKAPPGLTRAAALAWGQAEEHALLVRALGDLRNPSPTPSLRLKGSVMLRCGLVPTLAEFVPRYVRDYCEANRNRPSTIEAKLGLLRVHLLPALGHKRLDHIDQADVQQLKRAMQHLNPDESQGCCRVLDHVGLGPQLRPWPALGSYASKD
jgi:hypothetical protein